MNTIAHFYELQYIWIIWIQQEIKRESADAENMQIHQIWQVRELSNQNPVREINLWSSNINLFCDTHNTHCVLQRCMASPVMFYYLSKASPKRISLEKPDWL